MEKADKWKAFNHLDFTVSAGSTGIGFEVSSPIGDMVKIRAGFDFFPHFDHTMRFGIESIDQDGNIKATNFSQLSDRVKQLTGYAVTDHVDMIGTPKMNNFKLLVNVTPFRNKQWHLTAGFYWGPSKVATAVNTTEDMLSLVGMNMYNNFYDKIANDQPIISYNTGEIDEFGEPVGTDIYISKDSPIGSGFMHWGRLGVHIGNYARDITDENGNVIHKAGSPYMMEPDQQCMVSARVNVNSFRPFLGFGYEGRLIKGDDRYKIGFECGAMFWGGTPSIITHDGTNLASDVEDIGGKVGSYVSLIKAFKVFPVLNLTITRKIF